MKTVITIGRQFGSGGKEIGIRVAKELGIPFYDKELLEEAAKESGLNPKVLESFDERPKSLLYAIATADAYSLSFAGTGETLEQKAYLATFETIRRLAEQGPCVMIGRCADYVLEENPDHLSLFICAPLETRIARVAERQGVSPQEAKALILKTDKRRASYYEFYASKKWGMVGSYDFCIDSSVLGLGGTVELIRTIVEQKEHPVPSPTEEYEG
ncbi:MAG: cytidylate kinase-like family protein [Oscillibacter sp.]|nr:cytidylate kinase-like family protein [Oscillibacter sp.]